MQPSEALGVAAQVAVTLAGFAGIVVVFRPESVHRWSNLDRFRLQLLLTNSTLPLGDALFGMLLLTIDPLPVHIWRWCSAVGFGAQLLIIIYSGNPSRRLSASEMQRTNKPIFYGIAGFGSAAMLLQVINLLLWNRFWPFFTLIVMHLAAALVQFVRMVLLQPDSST